MLLNSGQIGLLRQYLTSAPEDEVASRINELDADQRTPLHWAASTGTSELVLLLLGNGAEKSLEMKDNSGWTPLMIAASAGNNDAAREFLLRGADPRTTNPRGLTPLHYAASKGHADLGRLLLEYGAEVNARDGAKQVPLHRASSSGQDAFVKVLLNPPPRKDETAHEKTRINPQDRLGNTPLHLAMDSANGSTAVLLLEAGVDRERTNSDGQAPEDIDGVGGQSQQRVRDYVRQAYGPRG